MPCFFGGLRSRFVASEAITNAAKRGTATRLHVSLRERDDDLAIAVHPTTPAVVVVGGSTVQADGEWSAS